jgi:hypothetical protein
VTGNTRLFRDAVPSHVAVNPDQFRVISHWERRDANDARNLAVYLESGVLPEVRMQERAQAQQKSLTQTRDRLKLWTSLKNKINNISSAHGINLKRQTLSSEKACRDASTRRFDAMVEIEPRVIVEQIRSLNKSIVELEKSFAGEGRKLERHKKLHDRTGHPRK